MKRENWDKLDKQTKELLAEIGINSLEDTKKPLWKQFEEADIHKRISFITLKNPTFIDELWKFRYINEEPENYKKLNDKGKELMNKINKGDFYEINPDEAWKSLYSSFRASNEWQNFRMKFLTKNSKCIKCSNIANTPHHKVALNKTALIEGFLKALENEDNFEPYCQECHAKEEGIIFSSFY